MEMELQIKNNSSPIFKIPFIKFEMSKSALGNDIAKCIERHGSRSLFCLLVHFDEVKKAMFKVYDSDFLAYV